MSINIGLDMRPAEKGFKAHFGRGTGRYAIELAGHLLAQKELADSLSLNLEPIYQTQLAWTPWEKSLLSKLPFARQTITSQVFFPRKLKQLKLDAVHFFAHGDAPAFGSVGYITSVLDLIPLRFPDLYKADRADWRFKFARYLELQAIKKSKGIIAISQCTKRDLVELLGIEEQKIWVTPLAVSKLFHARPVELSTRTEIMAKARIKFKFPFAKPILVYLGGIDPRKNVTFLLKVFAELVNFLPLNQRPVLVLAGSYQKDRLMPKLRADIKRLGLELDVILAGFVPDEDLVDLFHAADLTLFPSLYEGFGFPVLESMACGVPVVAGNNSSIPEVAGDSALLLPDNDLTRWTSEIRQLLLDSTRQAQMAESGIKRSKNFSWEKTACETLNAYASFLSSRGDRPRDAYLDAAA